MIETRWTCAACGFESPESQDICIRCECPRDADDATIAAHRAGFNGGVPIPDQAGFCCAKCGGDESDTGELLASGGVLSSMADISTRRFRTVTCARCGYTEFYRVGLLFGEDLSPRPVDPSP